LGIFIFADRILLDGIQSFASVCFPLMAVFFINKGKPTSVLVWGFDE